MARIQLSFPEPSIFSTELPVRITDLNYGGHLGNDTLLTLMHEARIHLYRSLGFPSEVSLEGTVGQLVADVAIVYRAEAFAGDVLMFELVATDFNKYGFDLFYRATRKADQKEIAVAKTGIVCFDYQKRKIAPAPARLVAALQGAI
jgi:YbgC/YbaW family acyl-CoA thioester hydrolase